MTHPPPSPVIDFEQATAPTTNCNTNTATSTSALARHELSRERQLLPFVPFSSSTLWDWSNKGEFISPT